MKLRRSLLWRLLGCVLFLGVWQWVAACGGGLALASPLGTWFALVDLAAQPWFWTQGMLPTLGRVLAGFGMGLLAGGLLGWIAGIYPEAALLLLPFRWVLSSVPGVVLVILAMLWCGVGSGMIILLVTLTSAPTIYMALQEGLGAVDPALCEMLSLIHIFTRWTPSLLPPRNGSRRSRTLPQAFPPPQTLTLKTPLPRR